MTRDEVLAIVAEARGRGEHANLSEAYLPWANLAWAVLLGAIGNISTFFAGQHTGNAGGGYICIGCERHPYAHWLEHGEEIGHESGYTDAEISRYMAWIRIVADWLGKGENGDV